ncbi:MAG: hypothetical protein V7785_09370 [Bermanella sp.]
MSFSSVVSAGGYCHSFKSGYRSVTNNLAIEPVCPQEPPIVFGQRSSSRGFNVGVKAAKADFEMGIGNGYEKKERCESGWCRFKDIHYSINAIFAFLMVVYVSLVVLSEVIFKELAFLKLRYRHREIWQEMGSPKLFALMDNSHLLKDLSNYITRMNEIAHSDPLLFKLIGLIIKLEDVIGKATWLIIGAGLISLISLIISKFF